MKINECMECGKKSNLVIYFLESEKEKIVLCEDCKEEHYTVIDCIDGVGVIQLIFI